MAVKFHILLFYENNRRLEVKVGQGRWWDKAASAAGSTMLLGGVFGAAAVLPAAIGAWRQLNMPSKIFKKVTEHVDGHDKRQREFAPSSCVAFLSHTGQDAGVTTFIDYLSAELTHRNLPYFYDVESLRLASKWPDEIRLALGNCKVFVAVLTPTYFKRYWCMYELDKAVEAKKSIIPVYAGCKDEGGLLLKDKEDLPKDFSEFTSHFKNDSRVKQNDLKRWFQNVTVSLRQHQAIMQDPKTKNTVKKMVGEIVTTVRNQYYDQYRVAISRQVFPMHASLELHFILWPLGGMLEVHAFSTFCYKNRCFFRRPFL